MKHLGFASIAALKQYLRYADARRLDTARLIEELGLQNNLAHSAEGRITGEQFQDFLLGLIKKSNDPTLGLSSALYVQTHSYSLLGVIAEHSNTLGDAIERIPLFERLVGDMGTTEVQRSSTSLALTWQCNYTHPIVRPHMIDNVLASWTLYARWLTNSAAPAESVRLTRAAPHKDIQAQYKRIFNAPILFGQPSNTIVISSKHLGLKLRVNSSTAQNNLEGKARSQLAQLALDDEPFDQRVGRSIKAHLQLGIASKELIAQEFNMSERNLQRHLVNTGTNYRSLLDDARRMRAVHFLRHTSLSPTEIAHNLGYSDERSFFRRFKSWYSCSPQYFRSSVQTNKGDA